MSEVFTPTPYHPDQFVDREDELRLIQAKLEQVCRGAPIDRPIVHVHGIPRVGKSWLLRHLAHQYASGASQMCGDKAVIVTSVNCRDVAGGPDWQRAILDTCRLPFQGCADSWRRQLDKATDLPDLSQVVQSMAGGCAALFLFDALDALDPQQFGWLDEALLEPLACSHRAVVVLAGRVDITRWRIETARRLHSVSLQGFGVDETAELGRKRGFTGTGQELYRGAQGHPYLARLLADLPAPWDAARARAIFQHVEDELLRDVAADRRRVIRFLAILRWFDLDTLRALLKEMLWDERAERAEASWLLGFFKEHVEDPDWLLWDRQNSSYRLVPVVRGVLLQQLQLIDPESHARGHDAACRLYKNWLQRYPYHGGKFLREAIYHQTAVEPLTPIRTDDHSGGLLALCEGCLASGSLSVDQAITLERDLEADQRLPEKQAWAGYYERIRQQLRRFGAGTGPYRHQESSPWNL